jgi:acyl dehydratase
MTGRTIGELREGDSAELTRVVEPADIAAFVRAIGDLNPLHSDPAFAAATMFKGPIAPGVFTAGMISAVIGTRLPGPGAVYVSQDLRFVRPVRAGDTITARVEVVELVPARNRVRLKTVCVNQRGEDVLTGEAWVLPSRRAIEYRGDGTSFGWLGVLAVQPWAWAARTLALWRQASLAVVRAVDTPP